MYIDSEIIDELTFIFVLVIKDLHRLDKFNGEGKNRKEGLHYIYDTI